MSNYRDSVHMIGAECFYRCRQLQKVTLRSQPSIHTDGSCAFAETKGKNIHRAIDIEVGRHWRKCWNWGCRKRNSDDLDHDFWDDDDSDY